MKTTFDGKDMYIGFKYTNTVLDQWLDAAGISREQAVKLKRAELKQQLSKIMAIAGKKEIPPPDLTHCILLDNDQKKICEASVTLRPGETHSRAKARIYALQKALKQAFDGSDFKLLRTEIWKTYHSRNIVRPVEVH